MLVQIIFEETLIFFHVTYVSSQVFVKQQLSIHQETLYSENNEYIIINEKNKMQITENIFIIKWPKQNILCFDNHTFFASEAPTVHVVLFKRYLYLKIFYSDLSRTCTNI